MLFLLGLVIAAVAVVSEAWGFMLVVGMAHIHLLDAVHTISYGVALQFVLISLPIQVFGVVMGALGDA